MQLNQSASPAIVETIEKTEFHVNEKTKILFVLSGTLEVMTEGKMIHLQTGEIYLVNAGEVVCYIGKEHNLTMSVQLILLPLEQRKEKFKLSRPLSPTYNESLYDKLTQCLASIFVEGAQRKEGFTYIIDGFIQRLVGLLLRYVPRETAEVNPENIAISDKISAIIDYINDHYQENLTLGKLAETFFISKYYLAHLFKKQLGISIGQYLQEIRLLNSVRMLELTNKSILDIALQNGFSTSRSFNEAFKKKNGITPQVFRKLHHEQWKESEPVIEGDQAIIKLLTPYISETDLMSTALKRTHVIHRSVDMREIKAQLKKIWHVVKVREENLAAFLPLVKKQIGFQYVAVQQLVEKFDLSAEVDSWETSFNKVERILKQILDAGMVPYLQIGAADYDRFKQITGKQQQEFYALFQAFVYFLDAAFPENDQWVIEFRCFYEFTDKGELCEPIRMLIPLFSSIEKVLIHFPTHPLETRHYDAKVSGEKKVFSIDDMTSVKPIGLGTALASLAEQKYLKIIEKNENMIWQSIILKRMTELEQDDYYQQFPQLIYANLMIWTFFNDFDYQTDFYQPVSLDGEKLFTYFPEELANKLALVSPRGVIRDSWFTYLFSHSLYSDVVFKNEYCCITKKNDNYRILAIYPENQVVDLANRWDVEGESTYHQQPMISLHFQLKGLNGQYQIEKQELTPEVKRQQKEYMDYQEDVILSWEDVTLINQFMQPKRSMKRLDVSEDYQLDVAVPLLGIMMIDLKKIK
jgi:AraC-like DNA-binding protein